MATNNGHILYSRSVSQPAPASLPKDIPTNGSSMGFQYRRSRSKSGSQTSMENDSPITFSPVASLNRYFSTSLKSDLHDDTHEHSSPSHHHEQGTNVSPTSWYSRLSSSLKRTMLRNQKRFRGHRRNVNIYREWLVYNLFIRCSHDPGNVTVER